MLVLGSLFSFLFVCCSLVLLSFHTSLLLLLLFPQVCWLLAVGGLVVVVVFLELVWWGWCPMVGFVVGVLVRGLV